MNNTIIVGEIENEDTVPGFVSVGATLVGKDGNVLGEETSFDKISHTLLPKEISPFRIDFPNVPLATVKSVRMQPNSMLVPASADPVIGALHQRLATDPRGRHVLKGDLVNESGKVVNIPARAGHLLRQCWQGHLGCRMVTWIRRCSRRRRCRLPWTCRPDLAAKVHNYRVTVNQYMLNLRNKMMPSFRNASSEVVRKLPGLLAGMLVVCWFCFAAHAGELNVPATVTAGSGLSIPLRAAGTQLFMSSVPAPRLRGR